MPGKVIKLKPCKCCESTNVEIYKFFKDYWGKCNDCGKSHSLCPRNTKKEAAEVWNAAYPRHKNCHCMCYPKELRACYKLLEKDIKNSSGSMSLRG